MTPVLLASLPGLVNRDHKQDATRTTVSTSKMQQSTALQQHYKARGIQSHMLTPNQLRVHRQNSLFGAEQQLQQDMSNHGQYKRRG